MTLKIQLKLLTRKHQNLYRLNENLVYQLNIYIRIVLMNKLSILGIFVADLAFFGKIPKVGETILGQDFVVGPGGKGSNQSVAAGKAGASINFITKVGDDDYGKMAFRIYKETNVGSDFVYVSKEHNTGVAAILLNKDTGENAISVVPGAAGVLVLQTPEPSLQLVPS